MPTPSLIKRSSRAEIDRELQLDGLTYAARQRREQTNPADDMERLVLRLQTAPPEDQPLLRWWLGVALLLIGQVDLAHDEARAYLDTREPTELDQALKGARELLGEFWAMGTDAGGTSPL